MNTTCFINVARWNFAINRSQYLKLSLGLFLAMSLPLLMFILKSIWVSAVTGNTEWALASIPGTSLGTWMCSCFLVALPLLAGYTFHNLQTKQSRIKELTLPASNAEKFLFHALVTIGGAFLTYIVGYFLLDILQYFYVGILYGFSNAHWISYTPIFFNNGGEAGAYFFGEKISFWPILIGDLALVAFVSTFVLGNAIKYKHGVLWTILFHWTLGFLAIFILGLCIPLFKDVDPEWLSNLDPDHILITLKWGILVVLVAVIVFCWWMSYRLYCRAQITTKRNK
ncbi:MAG: hypothetical protein IJ197_02000 [Bacteroidaceae bacterium]|nr:hypothetical protein [Bacteroidaceae bacterium]